MAEGPSACDQARSRVGAGRARQTGLTRGRPQGARMTNHEKPGVNFDVGDVCARFSVVYTGASSDVLDEMELRHQELPREIHGLTLEHRLAGVALPAACQPTESRDPD